MPAITSSASTNQSRPHVHEAHDLVVFVLDGEAIFHYKDSTTRIQKGDVIEVPKGVVHWAELMNDRPAVGYAVFAPALETPDTRFID